MPDKDKSAEFGQARLPRLLESSNGLLDIIVSQQHSVSPGQPISESWRQIRTKSSIQLSGKGLYCLASTYGFLSVNEARLVPVGGLLGNYIG